ncbi:hypothetical protein PPHE_a1056 [Pseudoalteromonas phenolica O-BC30]|nr:hypothetical protein [Pseudoalteromonas phenolica O-BC30]
MSDYQYGLKIILDQCYDIFYVCTFLGFMYYQIGIKSL